MSVLPAALAEFVTFSTIPWNVTPPAFHAWVTESAGALVVIGLPVSSVSVPAFVRLMRVSPAIEMPSGRPVPVEVIQRPSEPAIGISVMASLPAPEFEDWIVCPAIPEVMSPANVGVLEVAIDWGSESVTAPVAADATTWFAVPVIDVTPPPPLTVEEIHDTPSKTSAWPVVRVPTLTGALKSCWITDWIRPTSCARAGGENDAARTPTARRSERERCMVVPSFRPRPRRRA
jgi:hypothetical protein